MKKGKLITSNLLVAFSPVGEWIYRLQVGAKGIVTRQDIEYLYPLFEEVYESAKAIKPSLSNYINLYLIDDININAYAIGSSTIALTIGTVNGLSPDNLRGLLAHEFGHIAYGHTRAEILNSVGNGFFTLYTIIVSGIIGGLRGGARNVDGDGCIAILIKGVLYLVAGIIKALYYAVIAIGNILLSINSRQNEFLADDFAFAIGYGEQLAEALYLLNRAFPDGRPGIFSRLYQSHPDMTKRIQRLETLLYE